MSTSIPEDAFTKSRARFEAACCFMGGEEARRFTHAELEQRLTLDARELVRLLLQDPPKCNFNSTTLSGPLQRSSR